ncbi:MAG: hypothetical protein Q9217_003548 [Psora testacea]
MSKQYLTTHTIDDAHPTDIFSLATTPTQILSASGSSSIRIHSTKDPTFPVAQTLEKVHPLGCHHIAASRNGQVAASVGFGGEVKVWKHADGVWNEKRKITGADGNKPGEIWAIALSEDGQYLAATSFDGRINVWDDLADGAKIREFETKGNFGMSIDLSIDGRFTASGHENGLVKPVRTVAFSPGGKLLAAAGDSKSIALYDVATGEQVVNLIGHSSWIFSLSWSDTGEYLLSGSFDGKAKVWSIDRRDKFEHPADQETLCCSEASKVKSYLSELCPSAYEKDAVTAFDTACQEAGYGSCKSSSSSESATATGTKSGNSKPTSAPFPVVYTSTFYDSECSCTKTKVQHSSVIAGSSGFATGTAPVVTGTAAPSGSSVSGSGTAATGSPIVPVAPSKTGSSTSPTTSSFTGAGTKNVGSVAAGLLAVAGIALAL